MNVYVDPSAVNARLEDGDLVLPESGIIWPLHKLGLTIQDCRRVLQDGYSLDIRGTPGVWLYIYLVTWPKAGGETIVPILSWERSRSSDQNDWSLSTLDIDDRVTARDLYAPTEGSV